MSAPWLWEKDLGISSRDLEMVIESRFSDSLKPEDKMALYVKNELLANFTNRE